MIFQQLFFVCGAMKTLFAVKTLFVRPHFCNPHHNYKAIVVIVGKSTTSLIIAYLFVKYFIYNILFILFPTEQKQCKLKLVRKSLNRMPIWAKLHIDPSRYFFFSSFMNSVTFIDSFLHLFSGSSIGRNQCFGYQKITRSRFAHDWFCVADL